MEMFGNRRDYFNNFSQDDVNTLKAEMVSMQSSLTTVNKELSKWNNLYSACRAGKSRSSLYSCSKNQGYTSNQLVDKVRYYEALQRTASANYAQAKESYNTALESLKRESELGRTVAEEDIKTAKEWGEKGKTLGIWVIVGIVILYAGYIGYKKVRK